MNEWLGGKVAKWPTSSGPVTQWLSGRNTTSPLRHSATSPLTRGQSMLETAFLLGMIAIALVTFFSFIRNAVSSRVKAGADTFGHGLLHNGN